MEDDKEGGDDLELKRRGEVREEEGRRRNEIRSYRKQRHVNVRSLFPYLIIVSIPSCLSRALIVEEFPSTGAIKSL